MTAAPAVRAYAKGTKVAAANTFAQIQELLEAVGCNDIAHRQTPTAVQLFFKLPVLSDEGTDEGVYLAFRYTLPLPSDEDVATARRSGSGKYYQRTPEEIRVAKQAEIDRRWRALLKTIDAKLLGVRERIESVEQAFYSQMVVTGDGATMYEATAERVYQQYKTGQMGELLPGLPEAPRRTPLRLLSAGED